jgi:hypothetical protein
VRSGEPVVFDGQLEIDVDRGVIYFHSAQGMTLLRMQGLPAPIRTYLDPDEQSLLDVRIVGEVHTSWSVAEPARKTEQTGLSDFFARHPTNPGFYR